MTAVVVEHLGPDVPLHFTAFHPDWKMLECRRRRRRRSRGRAPSPSRTACATSIPATCMTGRRQDLLSRLRRAADRPRLVRTRRLEPADEGACARCGTACAGVFDGAPGAWGSRRQPVRLRAFA